MTIELSQSVPMSALVAPTETPAAGLRTLIDTGFANLPLPGHGQTLTRWRGLARVAAHDLSLLKLFEGHTDAIAILAEAGLRDERPFSRVAYGMWAAESPVARVVFQDRPAAAEVDAVTLHGFKAWCSGADALDRALLTAWSEDGEGPWLVDVDLRQPGVHIDPASWQAVGMAATASADVHFDGATARRIGTAGFYLDRPGFWHGGIGIAACWHGAACAVAEVLWDSAQAAGSAADSGWHRLLALGETDRLLMANAALLREAAAWLDQHPRDDASAWALRTRAASDECAQQVLRATARAVGAGPLCRNERFARMAADLPVFIRQSHGDRDLAALGALAMNASPLPAWTL